MADQLGLLEQTKEALTDPNETLGEKAPGTPFALVALSYLGVLAVTCGAIAFAMWIAR